MASSPALSAEAHLPGTPPEIVHRVYDPEWLRRTTTLCLWDGCPRAAGSEFCSLRCETRYLEWYRRRQESLDVEDVVEEPTELRVAISPETIPIPDAVRFAASVPC